MMSMADLQTDAGLGRSNQAPAPGETVVVTGLTNQEFLRGYARAGRIGLSGGSSLVDLAIARAERRLDEQHRWSAWSHAFLFEGKRVDGQEWLIESDLQLHRKHLQFGVQENRLAKYFDPKPYPRLAVLDFGLTREQVAGVLREALELVATHTRYSLRELLGTLLSLHRPQLRGRPNLLARDRCVFCSAFIQHLFRSVKLDLAAGVAIKNTTPEDLFRSPLPHTTYLLQRDDSGGKLRAFKERLKQGWRRRAQG